MYRRLYRAQCIGKIVLIGAYGIGGGSGVADLQAISIYENLLHLGTRRTRKLGF